MQKLLKEGSKAPDFSLPYGNGNLTTTTDSVFTLSKHADQNIILCFYPADWSTVCSSQVALYSQMKNIFAEYDAICVGISVDGTYCHKAFKDTNHLSIDLLCDFEPKGKISKLFGAYQEEMGVSERALFVIDKEGTIRYSYLSPMDQNPGAKEILETLKTL